MEGKEGKEEGKENEKVEEKANMQVDLNGEIDMELTGNVNFLISQLQSRFEIPNLKGSNNQEDSHLGKGDATPNSSIDSILTPVTPSEHHMSLLSVSPLKGLDSSFSSSMTKGDDEINVESSNDKMDLEDENKTFENSQKNQLVQEEPHAVQEILKEEETHIEEEKIEIDEEIVTKDLKEEKVEKEERVKKQSTPFKEAEDSKEQNYMEANEANTQTIPEKIQEDNDILPATSNIRSRLAALDQMRRMTLNEKLETTQTFNFTHSIQSTPLKISSLSISQSVDEIATSSSTQEEKTKVVEEKKSSMTIQDFLSLAEVRFLDRYATGQRRDTLLYQNSGL